MPPTGRFCHETDISWFFLSGDIFAAVQQRSPTSIIQSGQSAAGSPGKRAVRRSAAGPAAENWQDPACYAGLRGIDRAGLMWEWLRRNPDYVAWHAQASRITRGAVDPSPWGLHFR